MQISRSDFVEFIRRSMGISVDILPDDSYNIDMAYELARDTIYCGFYDLPKSVYKFAFLNLAAYYLVSYGSDQEGDSTFSFIRDKFGLNGFSGGIVQSSSDNGTSASLLVPDWMKNAGLAELQLMKTPWGREYLELSQRFAPMWGIV